MFRQLSLNYFLPTLLCCITAVNSYGQSAAKNFGLIEVEITREKKPTRIYAKVEIKSGFPGGDSSWTQSLEKKLNQSIQLDRKVKKGRYLVSVQFILDRDGYLSDIRCLHDPGFGIAEEIIRVLKKSPNWVPSPQPVRPYRKSAVSPGDK